MRYILAALAFVFVGLAGGEARAYGFGADGASLEEVRTVIRQLGWTVSDSQQSDNSPGLRFSVGGVNVDVMMLECDSARNCRSLQLWAGFELSQPVSYESINRWNADHRYGRAYVNSDGAYVEVDYDMTFGTSEQLRSYLQLFQELGPAFASHIGYR